MLVCFVSCERIDLLRNLCSENILVAFTDYIYVLNETVFGKPTESKRFTCSSSLWFFWDIWRAFICHTNNIWMWICIDSLKSWSRNCVCFHCSWTGREDEHLMKHEKQVTNPCSFDFVNLCIMFISLTWHCCIIQTYYLEIACKQGFQTGPCKLVESLRCGFDL